jgi:hypothetical protein
MDDVNRVAREILVQDKLTVAIVGPFKSDRRFQRLAQL